MKYSRHKHWTYSAIAVAAGVLTAGSIAQGCPMSYVDEVKSQPQRMINGSTLVVAGRAISIEHSAEWVTAYLEIDAVFKGAAPRRLVIRANRLRSPCSDLNPRTGEPFYAFLRVDHGNIQTPSHIGFVSQKAMTSEFSRWLGKARQPSSANDVLMSRLAPRRVTESIQRTDGEVAEERWLVRLDRQPDRLRAARFYLRYPQAVIFIDPAYVLAKLAELPYPAIRNAVSAALPLSEPTDLYKYALATDMLYNLTEHMDRLATEAVIDKRAEILSTLGYLGSVHITRTSLGVQTISMSPEMELQRSTWIPE